MISQLYIYISFDNITENLLGNAIFGAIFLVGLNMSEFFYS